MKKNFLYSMMLLLAGCTLFGCQNNKETEPQTETETIVETEGSTYELNAEKKDATEYTASVNESVYALLDFNDTSERENAERGLIYAPESLELKDEEGNVIWSQDAYAFVETDEAPDTANPSLWRNTQLNHIYGLFEVAEGIYQVRGYDMTNITFIEGDTGWIVFDPLMSTECSAAALQLVNEQLGERPVVAIVISHTHVDHFGGIKGIVSEEEIAGRQIPIIAPEGFEEHAVSENVYSGTAMGRRAGYQYGSFLEKGETGSLSIGIGLGQSLGTISYMTPNDHITYTGETRTIDGVTMEFQLTPGTEAPAEMNTWFPDKNALWMAENCTCTLHNLYTLRGAQVRDGNAWAQYIMEADALYGDRVEVVFQSHNWPHWGNETIREYMLNTASMYKFINDQTLMYINQGYTSEEIAYMIELPEELEKVWYTRQYYGTIQHNSKAVYQKYMGWYDANPVSLNALPKSESAAKFVEYMGGDADKILEMAKKDFEAGEYQWVAEITNILVYQDPSNQEARYLCADALEQLGYQAESGPWRNAYLSGAQELRNGTTNDEKYRATGSADIQKNMTVDMVLEYIGILLDSNEAQDLDLKINVIFDDGDTYLWTVKNGILLYQKGITAEDADATLTMPKKAIALILTRDMEQMKQAIQIEGDQEVLNKLTEHMVKYEFFFNIVEP